MKKTVLSILFALALAAIPGTSQAHVYDRNDSDHPLRYIAYVIHPIGMAVEYAVLRPIHWVVSQPNADKIFGHDPNREEEKGTYFTWE
jgi:hypothetical protein